MIYAAVTGAAGRMGTAIIRAIQNNPSISISGAMEREDSPAIGRDSGEAAGCEKTGVKITAERSRTFKKADVIIDFSTPESSIATLENAVDLKKAVVIGTTGFSLHQRDRIKELAHKTRVVMAPNMSVGVNLLFKLVADAASVVGRDYDIEIVEYHHRHKKDAPSGTALRIAEVAANKLGRDLEKVAVYERKGIIGERRRDEIGIQSVRGGDIVGDHTTIFAGPGERIEITHRASSRETFAQGAVRAALWVANKPDGIYDMQDVLGFKD
ncbi:MAG: 4-hydroxy-tetrahydrodipicolinate reductase [Thermodesulfobacteriota bacterium]